MYNHTNTIFNQLLHFIPKSKFNSIVGQHNLNKYRKTFSCRNLLLMLFYSQAKWFDSLRPLSTSISSHNNLFYHLWIQSVARSTLSDWMNKTDPIVFETIFYEILKECKKFDINNKFDFDNEFYALDSTTITLSLNSFSRAKYQRTKWACKIHLLLNNKCVIPEIATITDWKKADITIEKQMKLCEKLEKWSIVVKDRWYIDYSEFQRFEDSWLYFVTRKKINMDLVSIEDKHITEDWIMSDSIVENTNIFGKNQYTWNLRLVKFYDKENDKIYEFITNNLELSAKTIADIYKKRWQIEIFFKWIKQNLKIKNFLWQSENAVKNQIWIALIYYLILYYIKCKCNIKYSITELTTVIWEMLMHRMSLIDVVGFKKKDIKYIHQRDWPMLTNHIKQSSLF